MNFEATFKRSELEVALDRGNRNFGVTEVELGGGLILKNLTK